jgi:hypothetical protein
MSPKRQTPGNREAQNHLSVPTDRGVVEVASDRVEIGEPAFFRRAFFMGRTGVEGAWRDNGLKMSAKGWRPSM